MTHHDENCPCFGDVGPDFEPIDHPKECANCTCDDNPTKRGTRKKSLPFACLSAAYEYSKAIRAVVWAQVPGRDGVYQISPGGRNVFYRKPIAKKGAA